MPAAKTVDREQAALQWLEILVSEAMELERELDGVRKHIESNRDQVRGALSTLGDKVPQEIADWAFDFYPAKAKGERRSEDDIKATRAAKKAARKGATTVAESDALIAEGAATGDDDSNDNDDE